MPKPRTNKIWSLSIEEFQELIDSSNSMRDAIEKLSLPTKGTTHYKTLRHRAKEEGISLDALKIRGYESQVKANQEHCLARIIPLEDILVEGSTYNRGHLKRRLMQMGLLENKCSVCGMLPEWNGQTLVMVIDHINGVADDNRLENLRLVCPNCDSQLPTFCGRHKSKGNDISSLKEAYEREGLDFPPSIKDVKRLAEPKGEKIILRKCCLNCGKVISDGSKNKLCVDCFGLSTRKVEWPSFEELNELLKTKPKTEIAKMYGVSETAVRKWLKKYRGE